MIAETRELTPVRLRDAEGGAFLAVRGVTADVAVDGPLARTTLTVTFHNDLGRTLEGDLVFPLPPSAALRKLTVKVGKRTLEGRIRARERAQAEYTRAVAAGKTAALGETEGEDLARLRVAPIDAGEDVEITIALAHVLTPTDSGHRLIVPLTYMPRYVEDPAKLDDTERAAVDRPRPLTLAARANVTARLRNGEKGAPAFKSASHPTSSRTAPGATIVTVGPVPLDRDLHLEIEDRPRGSEPAAWIRHDPSEGPDALGPTTTVAVVPPAFADEGPVAPRTVTFLVDRSGSMNGGPMASAIRAVRGALRSLTPQDRFNVIAFDTTLAVLATRPVAFAGDTLEAADAFISSIAARGGTEATTAIAAALDESLANVESVAMPIAPPGDGSHRLKVVVFMTDGDIGNAEAFLKTAKAKLVDTRIHVLGIGDAVNHAMLSALATAGGGAYLPVATDEDLEKALLRLKNAVGSPLWTGLKPALDHEGERRSPKLLEPAGPIDLFAGQPVLLAFRGAIAPGTRLVLEGQRPDGEDRRLVVPIGVPAAGDSEDAAAASIVWALLKNRRLTYRFDPEDDATLEGLGTTFGLTNRQVALVGVDPEQRGKPVEGSVPVALPMPRNETRVAAYASAPMSGGMPFPQAPPPPGMAGFGAPPPMASAAAPPRRGVVMRRARAPVMAQASPAPAMAPPAAPRLTDDEAGLRALVLAQGADGLFGGELGATVAAVAALVSRGHTSREGLFKAELRRTVATLRARLRALAGDDRALSALALALLTMPGGEAPPAELPAPLAAAIAGLSVHDLPAARALIRGALAAAPVGWKARALAAEIASVFHLS